MCAYVIYMDSVKCDFHQSWWVKIVQFRPFYLYTRIIIQAMAVARDSYVEYVRICFDDLLYAFV